TTSTFRALDKMADGICMKAVMYLRRNAIPSQIRKEDLIEEFLKLGSPKKANGRCNVGVAAPIHFRGYCPHPSNHLRRRIHQPSLLPHNILRNTYAAQSEFPCIGKCSKIHHFSPESDDPAKRECNFFTIRRVRFSRSELALMALKKQRAQLE